jgi:hypothetical protein
VAGRIAAVSTTGLSACTVWCRKNAVSSSVSVPWVTTTPATSGLASWVWTARANRNQVAWSMSQLSICATVRHSTAASDKPGTLASSSAAPSTPAR